MLRERTIGNEGWKQNTNVLATKSSEKKGDRRNDTLFFIRFYKRRNIYDYSSPNKYSMKILTKKPKNSNENQKKAKSKNEKAKREGIFLFHRIKFIFYHVTQ